jgi:hypothetical protein
MRMILETELRASVAQGGKVARVRIESVERLNNSTFGNPRFRILWSEEETHGTAKTAVGTSYGIGTGLDIVQIELNGCGTIKRSISRA